MKNTEKESKVKNTEKIPENWPTDIPEDRLRERERIRKYKEAYEKGVFDKKE